MPIEYVVPPFRFGEPMDVDAPRSPRNKRRSPTKDRLKAYRSDSPQTLESYRKEFNSKRDTLQCVSFTEFATYVAANKMHVLDEELLTIRTKYFGFPTIQHSDNLVELYTGLPNASQFYYISSLLQRWIFKSYIQWETEEKHGFLNHTMITLMKLRLNIPDDELAKRFGIEPYMVNMTLRTWLPGLYACIYKTCEELYKVPVNSNTHTYTKVLDVVEVCFETPEYTRRLRNHKNEARKAVLCVRSDGFIAFASPLVSVHRPDGETIKNSRFRETCYNTDMLAVRPEIVPPVADLGVACRRMPDHAECNIREATNRIKEFRILQGIPQEYCTFHEYIFPVCAALSNFFLSEEDENLDLPDPQGF